MYEKKQLIKVNCSGRTKAMGLSVTALMLAVAMSGSVFAAGNIEDSGYSYNSTKNGFATPTRPKEDMKLTIPLMVAHMYGQGSPDSV